MIDFKTLQVWEKAHTLTLHIYQATTTFPNNEKFHLVSQMRRSCASIPTNLAEGCGRDSDKELVRFCNIAMGSACELEYQLILARDLTIIDKELFSELNIHLVEVKKMLLHFIRAVKKRL
jgi:four helix bundle protein